MKERTRLHIFGAEMDLVTPDAVFGFIDQSLLAGRACIVANHNLHSLYLYQRDAKMRRFFSEADLIEIDSTPVIAWARLLGLPARRAHRCTYLDFRDDFWRHACERGWRVYHVGGLPITAPLARAKILESYPNANLVTHHGYFDFDGLENDALLADIAEKKPHILLVGMGMPRQEQWIIANRHKLPVCAMLPVGCAFDYEAGVAQTPPRWAGHLGLEWAFRLAYEPKRLYERYLIEPWFVIPYMIHDLRRRLSPKAGKPLLSLTRR